MPATVTSVDIAIVFVPRWTNEWLRRSPYIPQALQYHRNWPADRAHPLVWTHLSSLEHVNPCSTGGDNSLENLVTTCSLCNYTKNNASIAQLNWELDRESREDVVWDGLTSLLPELQRLVKEYGLVESDREFHS